MSSTYRDWNVYFDPKPIPHAGFDWEATHPDYDGEGDARMVHAATFKELAAEIDSAIYEAEEGPESGAVDAITGYFGYSSFSSESKARQVIAALDKAGFDIVVRERTA
ncbi:hypothetical protein WBP06_09310 [Novosphingobium sp. BL-8H]|uniref:hypothetical protein n=1 Tax=Novosphingobium sp. BL-8H TaxID=3127640 RepID=UPI003757CB5B